MKHGGARIRIGLFVVLCGATAGASCSYDHDGLGAFARQTDAGEPQGTGGNARPSLTAGGSGGTSTPTPAPPASPSGTGGRMVVSLGTGGTTGAARAMVYVDAGPTGGGGGGGGGATTDAGRMMPPPLSAWVGPRIVVGVGVGGRRILSRDGNAWANDAQDDKVATADSSRTFHDAAFAEDVVVAVGGGCPLGVCAARVMTFNGDLWTEHKAPDGVGVLRAVAHGMGRFIAIGAAGLVATSPDGKLWISYDPGMGLLKGARRIAYGKIGNVSSFVVVGDGGLRAFSEDGDKWRLITRGFPGVDSQIDLVTLAVGSGTVVAAGSQGRRIRSSTGLDWSDPAAGGGTITSLIYSDKRFLAFDDAGNAHRSDNEGQTWMSTTVIAAPKTAVETGMMASSRLFVGAQGASIMSSQDGVSWRETQKAAGFSFTRFVFAGP